MSETITARLLLGAPRIIAFLRAALDTDGCTAISIANRDLDEGKDLDHIFRNWKFPGDKLHTRRGTSIKAERFGPGQYLIDFGCNAGPMAGDGGQWLVTYDATGAVSAIEQKSFWIS